MLYLARVGSVGRLSPAATTAAASRGWFVERSDIVVVSEPVPLLHGGQRVDPASGERWKIGSKV